MISSILCLPKAEVLRPLKTVLLNICVLSPLFAIAASPVWTKVAEDGGATVYVDYASKRRDGQVVSLTWVSDGKPFTSTHRRLRNTPILTSIKFEAEYECSTERYRILTRTLYTDHVATGSPTHEVLNTGWTSIAPLPLWRITYGVACGR